jgi:hypothetical protein
MNGGGKTHLLKTAARQGMDHHLHHLLQNFEHTKKKKQQI